MYMYIYIHMQAIHIYIQIHMLCVASIDIHIRVFQHGAPAGPPGVVLLSSAGDALQRSQEWRKALRWG